MIWIFRKELNSFLDSLIGYLVIGVFLTAIGLLTWVFPETSVLDYGYADLDTLFSFGPYILVFLVPAITMRTFAEERKLGTLELLLTKPVTEGNVVMGKYLASFALVVIALTPTLIYYFSLRALGNPPGNVDTPGVLGSYAGLLFLGATFCSIGVFASSITPNQVVSFVVATFLSYILYGGIDSVSALVSDGDWALRIRQLGLIYHYDAMGKGLIDSRDVVYFISVNVVFLWGSRTVLTSRSW